MGYSDLSIDGSDMASDARYAVCEAIFKALKKELKNDANEFNTPGYCNIAMMVDEHLLPGKFYESGHEGLLDVVAQARDRLVVAIDAAKKSSHWRSEEARKEHITAFGRLLKSCKSYTDKGA